MITNEQQYLLTKRWAGRFRKELKRLSRVHRADIHPRIAKAMCEGVQSQLDDLETQLKEYEDAHQGQAGRSDR